MPVFTVKHALSLHCASDALCTKLSTSALLLSRMSCWASGSKAHHSLSPLALLLLFLLLFRRPSRDRLFLSLELFDIIRIIISSCAFASIFHRVSPQSLVVDALAEERRASRESVLAPFACVVRPTSTARLGPPTLSSTVEILLGSTILLHGIEQDTGPSRIVPFDDTFVLLVTNLAPHQPQKTASFAFVSR